MLICGVDEAGRGALAGEVVAAAVVFGEVIPDGLRDSKKLSPARREALAAQIREDCMCFAYGAATVKEIDDYNILQATMLAMQRAVSGIVVCPDVVQVDGNRLPNLPYPAEAVIGGDDKVTEIMAASILAKVYRDEAMRALHQRYPDYDFIRHKGYPTAAHRAAIRRHGASPAHRQSFSLLK